MSAKLIRAWLNLKEQEDGATEQQIAEAIGGTPDNVNDALGRMIDCYIDRYCEGKRVWIAVRIPPNCPKPEPKRKATA